MMEAQQMVKASEQDKPAGKGPVTSDQVASGEFHANNDPADDTTLSAAEVKEANEGTEFPVNPTPVGLDAAGDPRPSIETETSGD